MSGEITLENYKTCNNGNVAECLISYDEQGILLEKKLEVNSDWLCVYDFFHRRTLKKCSQKASLGFIRKHLTPKYQDMAITQNKTQ